MTVMARTFSKVAPQIPSMAQHFMALTHMDTSRIPYLWQWVHGEIERRHGGHSHWGLGVGLRDAPAFTSICLDMFRPQSGPSGTPWSHCFGLRWPRPTSWLPLRRAGRRALGFSCFHCSACVCCQSSIWWTGLRPFFSTASLRSGKVLLFTV